MEIHRLFIDFYRKHGSIHRMKLIINFWEYSFVSSNDPILEKTKTNADKNSKPKLTIRYPKEIQFDPNSKKTIQILENKGTLFLRKNFKRLIKIPLTIEGIFIIDISIMSSTLIIYRCLLKDFKFQDINFSLYNPPYSE